MKIIHCADLHLDSKLGANLGKEEAKNRRDEILQEVSAVVESYPALPETYQSAVYYCANDSGEYLMIQNGDKAVLGQRQSDGTAAWKFNGSYWSISEQNELVQIDSPGWWDEDALQQIMVAYWSCEPVEYTSKPSSAILPLGVWPEDGDYLRVFREQMPNDMETMVFFNEESTKYIRWSVYNTNTAKICVSAANDTIDRNVTIPGWGDLPSEIIVTLGLK